MQQHLPGIPGQGLNEGNTAVDLGIPVTDEPTEPEGASADQDPLPMSYDVLFEEKVAAGKSGLFRG